jgi:ribosomal protein L7/L12
MDNSQLMRRFELIERQLRRLTGASLVEAKRVVDSL